MHVYRYIGIYGSRELYNGLNGSGEPYIIRSVIFVNFLKIDVLLGFYHVSMLD